MVRAFSTERLVFAENWPEDCITAFRSGVRGVKICAGLAHILNQ